MALITPSVSGAAVTYQNAIIGGDTMASGHKLHVRNGGVGAITVTITAYGACSHGYTHDLVFSVPAGEDRIINPPNTERYGHLTDHLIHIGYSGVTSVTVAAIA